VNFVDEVRRQPTTASAREYMTNLGKTLSAMVGAEAYPSLVIMDSLDADYFGRGFLGGLRFEAGLAVLWHETFWIEHAGEASFNRRVFLMPCEVAEPSDQAIILCSLGTSEAELRAKIYYAIDRGIELDRCQVICPMMSRSVWESLGSNFSVRFQQQQAASVNVVADDVLCGLKLDALVGLRGSQTIVWPGIVLKEMREVLSL
jgi:hypothetical protein